MALDELLGGGELRRLVQQYARRPIPRLPSDRHDHDLLFLLGQAAQVSRSAMMLTDAELDEPGPMILWVNDAFEELSGYTADEVVGRNPRFLQGPATDRAVLAELRRLLEAGEDFEGEAINYRADGTPFVMAWQITAIRGEGGAVTHFVAVQEDVTEARLAPAADRRAVLALQESLLPALPRSVPGYSVGSAHCAAEGQLVGGDWVDVVAAADGDATLAVVGDLTGHGAMAVASMGQMRWATRATAIAGLSLRHVLGTLRRLAREQDLHATVALLSLDPDGHVDYVCAGHPPALIVSPDGSHRWLDTTGPLVGLGLAVNDDTRSTRLDEGDVLVLYTDGLIERRHRDIDEGLGELARVAVGLVADDPHPQAVADALVSTLGSADPGEDDVGVLVLRRGPADVVVSAAGSG
jgi:PAS domain S-box-containing protein